MSQSSSITNSLPLETRSRLLPAWAMSCLLHVTILTVGAFSLHVVPRGIEDAGRGTGIVLVAASESGETKYFSSDGAAARQGAESSPAQLQNAEPAVKATSLPLPGAEARPVVGEPGLPSDLPPGALPGSEAGVPGASGLLGGSGQGSGVPSGTGEATLNVFGVEGKGSRFVYVFDRSSSMNGYGGRPLAAAKAELVRSLASLGRIHQFQIIFYNEEPHIFNTRGGQAPALCYADEATRESAMAFVGRITGDGGTQHMEALLKALSLSPDVIFFLTDANDPRLTAPELQRIRERNRRGTVINCIEFGAGPSQDDDNFLHRLALQNRGSRVYVDVTRLPRP